MGFLAGLTKLAVNRLYPPKDPTTSFAGKTVIITGANVGLGLEASVKFVALGASSLIMGVRNLEKGNHAKEIVESRTKRKGVVKVWQVDMSRFDSVKAFADRVDAELERVDVLELNAGVIDKEYHVSPEGWEQTLQVNVLSTALLALLLLPKLQRSKTADGPAHLTIVGSGTHTRVIEEPFKTDGNLLEWLSRPEDYGGQKQYGISKLLVEWMTKEMAAMENAPSGNVSVIINSLCPGLCDSELGRSWNTWPEWIFKKIFYGLFSRSSEEGSRTLVSGAMQGVEAHGKWWRDDGYPDPGSFVNSEAAQKYRKKSWMEILAVLGEKYPEIRKHAVEA